MQHDISQKLNQLAQLLRLLEPAFWCALETDDDESIPDVGRSRRVLGNACDRIDRLATAAATHFADEPADRWDGALSKSTRPIANRPGLALLPAPSHPAVERWQRTTPPDRPRQTEGRSGLLREAITASHTVTVVKPSSDYEAFLAKQLSPQTRRAYAADMQHFLNAVGLSHSEELLTVGPELLIGYRNSQIEAGVAPATIARRLSTLRSFFSMMVTLGRMQRNPADPRWERSPRESRAGVTPGIEPHEARKMLKAPDTSKLIGKRDRAILAVGLYMGLRRDEIARLDLSDIREERGHHVLDVRGKGGKSRVLAIPPSAYSAIQDYLIAAGKSGSYGSGPLFTSMGPTAGEGKRLSGRDVWDIVRKHAGQAGVNRDISPHSMRVAAITSALDNGAPIHRVQIMAGHADPRTTTR
jgi:site-specific recombinase XerD